MAGVLSLLGLIARRDRIKLPLTIVLVVISLVSIIPLLRNVYGDEASLTAMYTSLGTNPAMLFLTGPIDAPTLGGLMTIETLLWWGLVVAFINTMLVVRHTRHNEEIGAQELILSSQVHRSASLVAVMVAAIVVNGLIAAGLAIGMQLVDVTWTASQSWLYGLAMGAFGLAWAGIAAIVVQLVASGRTANSLLAALIGVSFVVRGVGDFLGSVDASSGLHEPAWMSSLSPFGWLQMTRPLVEPNWWPLVIPLLFWLACCGLGLALLARRDVGEGLLPSRRGRARASRFLATPLGLTWMLQRNVFIGWLLAILVMVLTLGALTPQMDEVFAGSDGIQQMIEAIGGAGELLPSFMSAMLAIISLMVFAYAIQALGKLRSEESQGHLEQLLATRLSRLKWIGLHTGLVAVVGTLLLAMTGSVMAVAVNAMSDGVSLDVAEYTLAALSYWPMLLAFMALYVVLFSLQPRLAGLVTWMYFGWVAFLSWLGPMLQLDDLVMKSSIMEHLATPPLEDISWQPIIVMASASLMLATVGLMIWRQRDLVEK